MANVVEGSPEEGRLAFADAVAQLAAALGVPVVAGWRHPRLGEGIVASGESADPADPWTASELQHAWSPAEDVHLGVALAAPPPRDIDWRRLVEVVVGGQLQLLLAHDAQRDRSTRLQRALYAIADLSAATLELRDFLRKVHSVLGELMDAANCYIVLYDDQRRTLRFLYFVDQLDPWVNDPDHEVLVEQSDAALTMHVIRTGKALRGPSELLRAQNGVPPTPGMGPHSADWLGVPMLRGDRAVGAIVVQSYHRANVYSDEDRLLLAFVAQHVQTALDRKQARDELERRVAERTGELSRANRELQIEVRERQRAQKLQRALYRIAQQSSSSQGLPDFYAELHSIVGELLPAHNFYISMLSQDGTRLEFPYSADERGSVPRSRPVARGLTEYVLNTAKPLLVDRQATDALEASGEVLSIGDKAEHWLGVPLMEGERAIGVMTVQSYSPGAGYSREDEELLTFVAHHIAIGLARKRAQDRLLNAHAELEQRVEERTRELAEANAKLVAQIAERMRTQSKLAHQAHHDILTGLPNRAQLLERLRHAIARAHGQGRTCFAVLFLDLDRFKLVNDSVGHAVGDELLIEVGRRIVGAVRAGDTVSRLGGDEFAILAENLDGEAMAEELAGRVLAALGAPVWIAGRELYPTGSIGITMWHPRYRAGEDMLRDADAAMYRAKAHGRDRSAVFDEAMRENATRTLDLETELRRGLSSEAFEPHYQPIVRLSDGALAGHEALLRWRHGRRGLLAPADFIDVGEETGLIQQVDWLLYEQVIGHMAGQLTRGYVAINVSPRHFRSPDFARRLLDLLQAANVPPSRLRIEITEMALLEDSPGALLTLNTLREHGVLAQLDDFGTGYSALSYLHRFPIASLKIDRSFVSGLDSPNHNESMAVVRAILALARSLGIESIAEGVESEEQCLALMKAGCDCGQGWLLGRPVAVDMAVIAA